MNIGKSHMTYLASGPKFGGTAYTLPPTLAKMATIATCNNGHHHGPFHVT